MISTEPNLNFPIIYMTYALFYHIDRVKDVNLLRMPVITLKCDEHCDMNQYPERGIEQRDDLRTGLSSFMIFIFACSSGFRKLVDVQISRTLSLNRTGSL